jgi:hypothetical protein
MQNANALAGQPPRGVVGGDRDDSKTNAVRIIKNWASQPHYSALLANTSRVDMFPHLSGRAEPDMILQLDRLFAPVESPPTGSPRKHRSDSRCASFRHSLPTGVPRCPVFGIVDVSCSGGHGGFARTTGLTPAHISPRLPSEQTPRFCDRNNLRTRPLGRRQRSAEERTLPAT